MEPFINPAEYLAETKAFPGFVDSLDDLQQQLTTHYANASVARDDDYPKIVFLGTGSCIPNKTRNVSSVLVHTRYCWLIMVYMCGILRSLIVWPCYSKDSCILLDCGEGTAGQLVRFYGKAASDEVYRKLKAIYVSHLHADHHIGKRYTANSGG